MNYKPLILCADDSLSVLEGWKMLLERNGYEVLTASDGMEAFQEFVSHPVDLVLLDYHMPHMNGDNSRSSHQILQNGCADRALLRRRLELAE